MRSFVAGMSTIILRGGVEVGNPLEVALEFLAAYPDRETHGSGLASFDESDLRLANRGGARISAAEIAEILERRGEIERALSKIRIEASLADATRSIPWIPLTQLFHAFADIRGVGFSKMTKALHRKRPALIRVAMAVLARRGRSGSAPLRSSVATRKTWIATRRSCTRSSENSRVARTDSPKCESSTSSSGPSQPPPEPPGPAPAARVGQRRNAARREGMKRTRFRRARSSGARVRAVRPVRTAAAR